MADAHDVNDEALVAHAANHAPVAYAVLPMTGPNPGQGLAQPARVIRLQESRVDEALNAALDRAIERGELVPRRGMKLNGPGQAAS